MPARLYGPHFEAALYGRPNYLGTIDATTTAKTNNGATTPFSNSGEALKGKLLLIQPDAAVFVVPVNSSTGTVTTSNGVKLQADQLFYLNMASDYGYLAAITSSGSANVRVFELV